MAKKMFQTINQNILENHRKSCPFGQNVTFFAIENSDGKRLGLLLRKGGLKSLCP
jgi:hypothetical protein